MLSTASGGVITGSVAFRLISHDLYVNESFPFPSYVSGTKVTVLIMNLQDGITYLFSVYASNVYGISDPASVLVPPLCESHAFTKMNV